MWKALLITCFLVVLWTYHFSFHLLSPPLCMIWIIEFECIKFMVTQALIPGYLASEGNFSQQRFFVHLPGRNWGSEQACMQEDRGRCSWPGPSGLEWNPQDVLWSHGVWLSPPPTPSQFSPVSLTHAATLEQWAGEEAASHGFGTAAGRLFLCPLHSLRLESRLA